MFFKCVTYLALQCVNSQDSDFNLETLLTSSVSPRPSVVQVKESRVLGADRPQYVHTRFWFSAAVPGDTLWR